MTKRLRISSFSEFPALSDAIFSPVPDRPERVRRVDILLNPSRSCGVEGVSLIGHRAENVGRKGVAPIGYRGRDLVVANQSIS